MTRSEFLKPWKTHLAFGIPFLALLLFNLIFNMNHGEGFGRATWHAFTAIKPVEYLMAGAFWYSAAFYRFQERGSELTTLKLGRYHK
jgi:hypothetical protein